MSHDGDGDQLRQRRPQVEGRIINTRENIAPTSKSAGWTLFGQLLITLITMPLVYIFYVTFFVPEVIVTKPFKLDDAPPLTGPTSLNKYLENAERLFEGEVIGPESIVYDRGHIYTGTADGKIIHIENGKLRTLAIFGSPPCGTFEREEVCGRPLGMRLDSDGYLIVLDAYFGLFKVNVATGDYIQLFSSDVKIEGESPKFLNDMDIAEDGTIYFTDTSTKWPRKLFPYCMLEPDNSGRLLKYDPKTNETKVLVRNLKFPNGVQISSNQEFLLFTETVTSRIGKYYLKGEKEGKVEVFADKLPGLPDNIRRVKHPSGGYWVALPICRNEGTFSLLDFLYSYPWLRSLIAKAVKPEIITSLGTVRCGRIAHLDKNGKILRVFHDVYGKQMYTISEVEQGEDGVIYLGSFKAPFIGKLNLNKL